MQKFVLACAMAMLTVSVASASDIYTGSAKDQTGYQTPDDSWTGPYIGIHLGWAGGDWNGPLSYDDHDPKWTGKLEFDDSDKTIDADGWLAGGQIGYDWQLGNTVVGIEGDLSYMDVSGEGSFLPYPNNPGSPAWEIKSELEVFGTLRGRFGLLLSPDLLAYGTAGLAFARVNSEISPVYEKSGSNGLATNEATHLGWTVGTGLEWRFKPGWSLAGEYLYADLGEEDYAYEGTTKAGGVYDTDHHHPDLTLHVVRGKLNYRF